MTELNLLYISKKHKFKATQLDRRYNKEHLSAPKKKKTKAHMEHPQETLANPPEEPKTEKTCPTTQQKNLEPKETSPTSQKP
jgi:hypothetical protein